MESNQESDFFAVEPITNCPHATEEIMQNFQVQLHKLKDLFVSQKCENCPNQQENWFCLKCSQFLCSRYQESHMIKHHEQSNHNVVFSLSDASTWCYQCDSYITNNFLNKLRMMFSEYKFGSKNFLIQNKEKLQ